MNKLNKIKILAIGDPHGKLPKNLDKLVRKEKPEAILCVGDIPPLPPRVKRTGGSISFSDKFTKIADKKFEYIIDKFCSYGLPVLVLRGNMYLSERSAKVTKRIFSNHKNLHYKKTAKMKIRGIDFIFFDMIWEPEMNVMKHPITSSSKRKYQSGKIRGIHLNALLKNSKFPIVLSHAPPYGILDKIHSGHHIGSRILLNAIKKHPPSFVLCGHVHEAKGIKKIGKTTVINLGDEGQYKIVEIKTIK
jgi:hypothetical protein